MSSVKVSVAASPKTFGLIVSVESICTEIETGTIQLDGLRLRRTDISPGSLDRLNETTADVQERVAALSDAFENPFRRAAMASPALTKILAISSALASWFAITAEPCAG